MPGSLGERPIRVKQELRTPRPSAVPSSPRYGLVWGHGFNRAITARATRLSFRIRRTLAVWSQIPALSEGTRYFLCVAAIFRWARLSPTCVRARLQPCHHVSDEKPALAV